MALLQGGEGGWATAFHGVSLAASVAMLGLLLNQHKIWVRMKDRLDELWRRHCKVTGDDFKPLENGKH